MFIDAESPVIGSELTNINVNTDPDLPSAVVTWDPVTATDNSGSVTLTSNHQSGDTFLIGDADVVYNATDPSGNVVSGWFIVSVTGEKHISLSRRNDYLKLINRCVSTENCYTVLPV